MAFELVFPSKRVEKDFEKILKKIHRDYQEKIVEALRNLVQNPRPQGKSYKKLTGHVLMSQFTAEHRIRIGPYRILYDVDDTKKKIILLKLARRSESTYEA
jgi:mRNA interferase RelE/StbE